MEGTKKEEQVEERPGVLTKLLSYSMRDQEMLSRVERTKRCLIYHLNLPSKFNIQEQAITDCKFIYLK